MKVIVEWDTSDPEDGTPPPTEQNVPDIVSDDEIADYLSDKTGWLVVSADAVREWPQGGADNTEGPTIVKNVDVNMDAYAALLDVVEAAKDIVAAMPFYGRSQVEARLLNELAARVNAWQALNKL